MDKKELIGICKLKASKCVSKYDFKKKYGYWYKLCCKEKIIDIIFENYNTLDQHYKNQSSKYSLEYLLNFCKDITKTELIRYNKSYYMLLTSYYKVDIKRVKFRKKKRVNDKYTNEYLIKITKDIRYKIDFLNRYPNEYKYCKNKNIFNVICPHLIPFNISMPQMILKYITDNILNTNGYMNNRKVLYPYEIDVFYEKFKLGFEYNGKYWHKENKNDILKNNKADKEGIRIITICENNRRYESDIKTQLVSYLNDINRYTNNNIKTDDVTNIEINYDNIISYNIEYYKEIAKKYKNRTEFSIGNNVEYLNCVKLGIMNIVAPHFVNKIFWNEKSAILESKKYNSASELLNNKPGCYCYLSKNNLLAKVKYLNTRFLRKNIDINYLLDNFKSIDDLLKNNNSLYNYILNNNCELLNYLKYYSEEFILGVLYKMDTFSNFKGTGKIYKMSYSDDQHKSLINNYFKNKNYNKYFILDVNIDEIVSKCVKYNNIKLFRKDYPTLYKYLLNNKLINTSFKHIDTLKFRNGLNKQS